MGIRSFVDQGTYIQRSIVMGNSRYESIEQRMKNGEKGIPNMGIGPNCVIKNSIVDLDVSIGGNVHLINNGQVMETQQEIYSIRDGIIIIPKGFVIPHNTII
jgi:glucose-1-phosphate adenylyltransferase